jgi:hypothetical protein
VRVIAVANWIRTWLHVKCHRLNKGLRIVDLIKPNSPSPQPSPQGEGANVQFPFSLGRRVRG